MTARRKVLKTLGLSPALFFAPQFSEAKPFRESSFSYCLNTSTIRGQNPGILKYIEIASQAGYEGIELWMEDIKGFIKEGNSIAKLRKHLEDHGIRLENAIGFAPWMVEDEAQKKAGFIQMREEMNVLAELGGRRIAAPAIGAKASPDLFSAGHAYKELLELGRSTGVMPQLEFWGGFEPFHHLGQTLMVAAVANDPDARILADVYHLFRGDSGFDGLKMLSGNLIEIFHFNDYPASIPREQQQDTDRVYPGDGTAPMREIVRNLKNMGGNKVLSLELFNPTYWKEDPLTVAKIGLSKMKEQVKKGLAE